MAGQGRVEVPRATGRSWTRGRAALALAAVLLATPACGPRGAPDPNAIEFEARTEGTPAVLASHLDAIAYRYQNTTAGDPRIARSNFLGYSDAVLATAERLWEASDATYAQRKKAGEMILEVLLDRREYDPQSIQPLLAWADRIEAEAPPDSDLIATAAYYRFKALEPAGAVSATEVDPKPWIDAALKLGRVKPPRPEAGEMLSRVGDLAQARGLDEEALQVYSLLAESFPESPLGLRAAGMARRLSGKGQVVEDIAGPSLTGETLSIQDYRGKVVLVVFWGTELQPLEALGLDTIASFRERFPADEFAVLGVLFDFDIRRAERFLAGNKIDWPQILSPADITSTPPSPPALAMRYGVEGSPFFMVIDREGRLGASGSRLGLVAPSLEELLSTKPPTSSEETPDAATPATEVQTPEVDAGNRDESSPAESSQPANDSGNMDNPSIAPT